MKIACVIVDVPTRQTDRTFDYLIPDKWAGFVEPGTRVIVPFGPRKVNAFVVGTKVHSDHEKLKSIDEVLDIEPVLTSELLELGEWLAEQTMCFMTTALQVMLPRALKAKVEKEIRLTTSIDKLPEDIKKWFQKTNTVFWKDIQQTSQLNFFHRAIANQDLEVAYQIKNRVTTKQVRYIDLAVSEDAITKTMDELPVQASKQKDVLGFLKDNKKPIKIQDLLKQINTTESPVKALVNKGLLKEEYHEVYRDPYEDRNFKKTVALPLSSVQEQAIKPILKSIEKQEHETFLIHGVTGSGKTEIYLQSINEVLKKGKDAIVLVPEIALTPQMVNRFKSRFGSQVAVMHSGLSTGEKYDEWRKIKRGEVRVVVGARSAIFAPFLNIGIIIIDEEHETSYKQEDNPRYHARDIAIYRGNYHQCPVVLGSATPSLESYARANKGIYKLITMEERINNQAMPGVEIIDMREQLRQGNRSMFSNELYEKLKDRLDKGEQVVLFLNRRGYSTFVMCRDCGHVVECPHCDISLTYHRSNHRLKCHYCAYETSLPSTCPSCASEYIRFFGTGTQKVEEELTKVLPEARVIRMDVDTTSKKGSHERLLDQFGQKKADILLGTQMIAKGLDFPSVTLVGVLAADSMLHIPDFRASEKTFQLITQVSGRAGRHELPGEVIIQTYSPEHYSIELASHHNYLPFYMEEMKHRKKFGYPPFYYLTLITISHQDLMKVVDATEKVSQFLRGSLTNQAKILGPVAASIPRIKDRYRYQCMIKYKNEPELTKTLKKILDHYQSEIQKKELQINIDMNPYMLM